jgi:DNA-binding transcriptional regulator YhcF (GntR family)
MASKKKTESFTQIPNWYWQCGLDIYEVNIIARIASWQRDNKDFFESYDSIAEMFNTSYNTIRFRFAKLEKDGIIKKNGKRGRSWKWIVSINKLNALKDSVKTCHNNDQFCQEMTDILSRDDSYNTPKTSNKTSFRERESSGDSLSPEMKALILFNDIDI